MGADREGAQFADRLSPTRFIMKMRRTRLAGIAFALLAHQASAAEIKVLTPRAGSTLLAEIGPQFERATGNKITVSVDLAAALTRRVKAGEDFDLLLAAPGQIEGLAKDGKIVGDSVTNVLRSGLGVEVKAGAPKPDISTVDAFKR